MVFISLALGTLVSEDLACIAAGLLIERGVIDPLAAIGACAAGIFAGDLGLWGLGRAFGRAVLGWPWLAAKMPRRLIDDLAHELGRRAGAAIVSSRFLPGSRLPLYVMSGVLGISARRFALWTCVSALAWTPLLVLSVAALGEAPVVAALPVLGSVPLVLAAGVGLVSLTRLLACRRARQRVAARIARWSRWEFWPMGFFYAPVAIWVAWLSLRYRGPATMTAANPGMADGGTVGESKHEILARLPPDATIPSIAVQPGALGARLASLAHQLARPPWRFPLVLKPDVGQRGLGVKLVRTMDEAAEYFARAAGCVLVQPYHDGPFEAGIFYYRMPGWARGRILSITDKQFPFVVGDGRTPLEELIWSHPRYRMQAQTFLVRHHASRDRVLELGERFQLAMAGNHAQGTTFRDGRHLLTPALELRIDEIARAFGGFHVGRFDVRYRDIEAFRAGRDLAIVELNGATAESTNIYDPDATLLSAYRQLFRQWSIVFEIGAANRAAGAAVTPVRRLLELVRAHLTAPAPFPVSD